MTTSDRQTPKDRLPGSCQSHVADQLVHIARLVHGAAPDPSLTPAQWTALRYFANANRFSRTPSAFSQFHATTRGTASQTVKSLISAGLLERHVCKMDARSALIEVTPDGHQKLANDPLSDLCSCIDALPEDMRNSFTSALSSISAALSRKRDTPAFGNCGDCGYCETSEDGTAYCHCTQSMLTPVDMDNLCIDFAPPRMKDR